MTDERPMNQVRRIREQAMSACKQEMLTDKPSYYGNFYVMTVEAKTVLFLCDMALETNETLLNRAERIRQLEDKNRLLDNEVKDLRQGMHDLLGRPVRQT